MQSNVERLDKTHVLIEVGLDPAEVEEGLGEAYARVARKVKIPGFRPGKAPRSVLEAHYGKEVLYEEAVEILVPKAYHQALHEHDLEPIDRPEMSVVEPLTAGQTFVFKATVEVLPEVKLGPYLGVKAEKPSPVVQDEAVERELEALRERYAELVLSDHATLAKGDYAVVDFDGYLDGQPFQGGSAKGYTLEVGGEGYLPGFAEGMIGMRPDETREIPVKFPEDYQAENLAGREAKFAVNLHEIKTMERPALDDELAKSLGQESVEALRDSVRSSLQAAADRQAEQTFTERVLQAVVKGAEVEIPEVLVTREIDRRFASLTKNLEYQGLTKDKYLATLGKTEDEIRAEMRTGAEGEVRQELVIEAIRKAEGMTSTEEELVEKVAELAKLYRAKDPAKLRRDLEKSGRIEALRENLAREKTVHFLVEKAEALPERKTDKG